MVRSKAGQMTIEAILIMTLLFSAVVVTSNYFQQNQVLASLVESPWGYLGGMIENGIWLPPIQGQVQHPNHRSRHASPQGDAL